MAKTKNTIADDFKKLNNFMAKYVYGQAMTALTFQVKKLSMKKTPIDHGYLRSATFTRLMRSSDSGIKGVVFNTADYSLYVHEDLKAKHTVGESKFLEKAANEVRPKAKQVLGAYIKKALF